jgi:hypothetical protein
MLSGLQQTKHSDQLTMSDTQEFVFCVEWLLMFWWMIMLMKDCGMCLEWSSFVRVVRRRDLLIWGRNLNNYELRMTKLNYELSLVSG